MKKYKTAHSSPRYIRTYVGNIGVGRKSFPLFPLWNCRAAFLNDLSTCSGKCTPCGSQKRGCKRTLFISLVLSFLSYSPFSFCPPPVLLACFVMFEFILLLPTWLFKSVSRVMFFSTTLNNLSFREKRSFLQYMQSMTGCLSKGEAIGFYLLICQTHLLEGKHTVVESTTFLRMDFHH